MRRASQRNMVPVSHCAARLGAVAVALVVATVSSLAAESSSERDARMRWWREARFGMFIHWGLYSEAAGKWNGRDVPGIGEWILHFARIPVAEYEPLRERFNPVDFDAEAWVDVAKRAGMKYIVITSKHHDGFCLWPSARTEWDIASTPFGANGRDPLGELYAACERAGIRLCLYHSIMDWHHPDYLPRREWDSRPTEGAHFDRYREYLHGQIKELLARYPRLGVLWFDGEWEETWTHEHGVALDDLVRSRSPAIIVNNRVDKGRAGMSGLTRDGQFRGDFGTPEQEIPGHGVPEGVDWESCMTMNDTWGFKSNDQNWKSVELITRMLVEAASKGGNFLLNVGPDGRGRIPAPSIERLDAVGRWLEPRGEAIYGTRATPFGALDWGRCTQRTTADGATRLYCFVFEPPDDGRLRLPGLVNEASGAQLLGVPKSRALPPRRDEDALEVDVSDAALDGPCPVVVIDLRGELEVRPPPEITADAPIFVESTTVSFDGARAGETIRYTLDGSTPKPDSPAAPPTISIDRTLTVSARIFSDERALSAPVSRTFTRVTPRPADSPELGPGSGLAALAIERARFARVADIGDLAGGGDGERGAKVVDNFIAASIGIERRPRDEHFALRFSGFIRAPARGVYTFVLESDDGAILRIGEEVVVDNDGLHERRALEGRIALEAGWHPIRVVYFNAGGDRALSLEWEGPGTPRGAIPSSALGWAP